MKLRTNSRRFARYINTVFLPPERLATMSRADILRKVRSAFDLRERFYEDVSPEVLWRIVYQRSASKDMRLYMVEGDRDSSGGPGT